MTTHPLTPADADALLSGRCVPGHADLQQTLGLLRAAGVATCPPPSAALAAVLAVGFDPAPVAAAARSAGWRRRTAGVVLASVAALTATAGAAAANALPAPVQSAVADAVEALTALRVPRPGGDPAGEPSDDVQPVPPDSSDPAPVEPFEDAADPDADTRTPDARRPGVVPPDRPTAPTPDDGGDSNDDGIARDDVGLEQRPGGGRAADGADIDQPDETGPDNTGPEDTGSVQPDGGAPDESGGTQRESDLPAPGGGSSDGLGSNAELPDSDEPTADEPIAGGPGGAPDPVQDGD